MTQKHYLTAAMAALVLASTQAEAQISVTSGLGLTYAQNFDGLTRSTTAETWVNDANTVSTADSPRLIGLLGWYTGSFGTTTTTPLIRAGTGSSTSGSFYSFGSTGAEDRALGTLPSDSSASASMRIGVRFVNDTSDIITGFSFAYDGEQWRKGQLASAQNNQYVVAYGIFAAGTGSLDLGYAPSIASATFNTPVDGGDNSGASLDGNLEANRVAGLGGTVEELAIMPGEEIWLRWFDSNSSGADHGLAIDNFTITFSTVPVPEPTAGAMMGLGIAMLLAHVRSRK